MAAQDNPDSNVSYSLPPFARRWMRLVLGLSVGIGLGLAPFLGKLPVPGFDALLTAFPEDLRLSLIPMSAFLMGSVAVGMQFLYGEHVRRKYLRLGFLIAFAAVMAGFFWLIFIYDSLVAHIDIPATGTARSFVIAPGGCCAAGTCC